MILYHLSLNPVIYVNHKPLTPNPKDVDVYDYIVRYREAHVFSPTLSEIGVHMKSTRQRMYYIVTRLVKMGCLLREPKQNRGLVPVKSPLTLVT